MIARVRGRLVEKDPTRVVVDCHGIGLELGVPLSTSRSAPDVGGDIDFFVDTYFTRSGVQLFGFASSEERAAFRLLTSVKGIGPRAGLNLLSRLTPSEIRAAIVAGRVEVMRSVPGIGPKKADSIIRKLQQEAPAEPATEPILADAESALVSLGLTHKEARQRLARVAASAELTLQELLVLALRIE